MSTKTPISSEINDLRSAIRKLTGRQPVSSDPRYLRERLAALKSRQEAGEDIRRRNDPAAPLSISLSLSARRAISRILEREKISTSELGRQAFALWAEEHGYKIEAKTIEGA